MAKEVRLLPALMAVSVGALAFKAIDIAEAATEVPPQEAASAEDASHAEDSVDHAERERELNELFADEDGEEMSTQSDTCLATTPDFSAETGLSQHEIAVLRNLASRRQELDERAGALDTREQMAAAAEARLNDQIEELKELESGIQTLLLTMEQKRDERLEGLVKVYESMKPKNAAKIFETLGDDVLLEVSQRMKHASLAAVMSSMSPERANQITRLLAERAELPSSVEDVLGASSEG